MRNYWTKKECTDIIEQYKDNTAYFGNDGEPMEFHRMYNMLRYQMKFGEAETMVIIASLIKAGGTITN